MFGFGNGKNGIGTAYQSYLSRDKTTEKTPVDVVSLATVVEKYKAAPQSGQANFRKKLGKDIRETYDDKEAKLKMLKVAKEIGTATAWNADEIDNKLTEPLIVLIDQYHDDPEGIGAEVALACLNALWECNYWKAEFWEQTLWNKNGVLADFTIGKLLSITGGDEVLKNNMGALATLIYASGSSRKYLAENFSLLEDGTKGELLHMFMEKGVPLELIQSIANLIDSEQTRLGTLVWLTSGKQNVYLGEIDLENKDLVTTLVKQAQETLTKEVGLIVEKLKVMLATAKTEERMYMHKMFELNGVESEEKNVKLLKSTLLNHDAPFGLRNLAMKMILRKNNPKLKDKVERALFKKSMLLLDSGAVEKNLEAHNRAVMLFAMNQARGIAAMKKVYAEMIDIRNDVEAPDNLRKLADVLIPQIEKQFGKKQTKVEQHTPNPETATATGMDATAVVYTS
ncbi:MAG: hypothetical protein V1492_01375 [Candidatus Micrarchaeota archaeon]